MDCKYVLCRDCAVPTADCKLVSGKKRNMYPPDTHRME